jgi:hypothetical protein
MRNRHLIVAMALALALSVAAPTVGSPADRVPADIAAKASFANKTSKRAKQLARDAKRISQKANRKVNKQRGRVNALGQRVGAVEREVRGLGTARATAAATVSTTEDGDYVALGGPQVSVRVGESGLIEVWAQATIVNEGAVSLYEDGQQLPGQAPNGTCDGPPGALMAHSLGETLTLSTPTGTPLAFCGSEGPPAPVLFETTPGEHIYELRYADCGCTPDGAAFADRVLTVAPRP